MKWEDLTSDEFQESIKITKGVAIIPYGCLERHGHHLPLGTDMFIASETAIKAASIEEALVVPIAPYGIISEAQHTPGCLSLTSHLQYEILEELCDELARNGYHKIIILDGHGGAKNFLAYFSQSRLEKKHDYVVYHFQAHYKKPGQYRTYVERFGEMPGGGHADRMETSEIMYLHPTLVHKDKIVVSETQPMNRNGFLIENGAFTGMHWYGDYPYHIAGDPTDATVEQGEYLFNMYVNNLVDVIRLIKNDDVTPALLEEFYSKLEH